MTNGAFCLGRYRYVDCERMDFIATRRTDKKRKKRRKKKIEAGT